MNLEPNAMNWQGTTKRRMTWETDDEVKGGFYLWSRTGKVWYTNNDGQSQKVQKGLAETEFKKSRKGS